MVNPFAEFQTYEPRQRSLPLDRIIAVRDAILEQLLSSYTAYIDQTELDWEQLPDPRPVERAYQSALRHMADLTYSHDDIEDFCFSLEQLHTPAVAHDLPDDSPSLWGLSGLYLSALCNRTASRQLQLRLQWMPARVHLLGYQLPVGKRLDIEGLCGDFLGMALAGGEISLRGSAFHGVGFAMRQGKIVISDNAGENVGQDMLGGEIHVLGGRIRGVGRVRGGSVYLGQRRIAPAEFDDQKDGDAEQSPDRKTAPLSSRERADA